MGAASSGGVQGEGLGGVVPFTWACRRSGRCCSAPEGYVFLAPGEVAALAGAAELAVDAFRARHVRTVPDPRPGPGRGAPREVLAERTDGRCSLLEGTAHCSVYRARPEHCRRFPYWERVLRTRAGFEAARATCPGIAVRPDADTSRAGFERLDELAAALDAEAAAAGRCGVPTTCALPAALDAEHFVGGLEADWVVARAPRAGTVAAGCPWRGADGRCGAGAGRPFACRLRAVHADAGERAVPAERVVAALAALARALGWPASYGRLAEQVASRR